MPVWIAVAGFLGGWLLVAGPVFQAAVELDGEEVDRAGLAAADSAVPPPQPQSPWWWLLPPVAVYRQRQATRHHREAMLEVMSAQQVAQLISFGAKATGWLLVAGGASLIALKETWELVELLEGPVWAFVLLVLVSLLLSFLYAALRMRRAHRMLAVKDGGVPAREHLSGAE